MPTAGAEDSKGEQAAEFVQRVRVVNADGEPVAGARVWVPRVEEVDEQRTDADGRCRLRGDPNRLFMTDVTARAEGYFPGREVLAHQPELVVTLRGAAMAFGRVLERGTGAPIADARVSSFNGGGDVEADAVTTDAGGHFSGLAVPESGSFLVDVEARGYLQMGLRSKTLGDDPEDPAAALELLLDRARTGYFLVVDSGHGQPIPGASVHVGRTMLTTDVEGRVTVDSGLRPEDSLHHVRVSAADHCTARYEVQGFGAPESPIVLRLPPACRVEGVVLAPEGGELPPVRFNVQLERELSSALRHGGRLPVEAYPELWPENAEWVGSFLRSEYDAGRFVIENIPPGLPALRLALYVDAGTLARRTVGPLGGPGSTLRVDWQLDPPGNERLQGRVLLDGEPRVGTLYVQRDGLERVTTTGDDGRYEFTDLRPGTHSLTCELRLEGVNLGDVGRQSLEVEVAQGVLTEQDVRFDVSMDTIRGSLSDSRGAPLGGVRVWARHSSPYVRSFGESASDGSWSLSVPVLETPFVLSCDRTIREQDLEVLAGTEGVELRELARGRLRFRVLDAVTGDVLRSPVLARPAEGNLTQAISVSTWPDMEPSGWCEKELPAGPIELGVFTHGGLYRSERRVLEIPAEGVVEAEFRLAPAVRVQVRLDPEGGALPEHHVVQLLSEADWGLATAELGPRAPRVSFDALPFDPLRKRDLRLWPGSAVTVGGLAPGRHRFKVFPDDVAIEPEWVDVPADGVVDVTWSAKP